MIRLYMDENVRGPVTRGLRARQIDCLTAQEDGFDHTDDELVLARATSLDRLIVTYDEDFLAIANRWLVEAKHFSGVVKSHQEYVDIGTEIDQPELICTASDLREYADFVLYLPLR